MIDQFAIVRDVEWDGDILEVEALKRLIHGLAPRELDRCSHLVQASVCSLGISLVSPVHYVSPMSYASSYLLTIGRSINDAKSASTSSFVTAMILNTTIFAVELAAFTILRPRFKAVYEPRTITPVKR